MDDALDLIVVVVGLAVAAVVAVVAVVAVEYYVAIADVVSL